MQRTTHTLLTPSEELALLAEKTPEAEALLVEHNQRLVMSICRTYLRYTNNAVISLDDLMQWGNEGLIEAIRHFDPTRGVRLSTYATRWIKARVSRPARKVSANASMSHRDAQATDHLRASRARKYQTLRRVPTTDEIASTVDAMTSGAAAVLLTVSDGSASLDAPVRNGSATFGDFLASDFDTEEEGAANALVATLMDAIGRLPENDQAILKYRYGIGTEKLSQPEIAARLGVPRGRVDYLERKAIQALRMMLGACA